MRDDYTLYPELYDIVYEDYLEDIPFYVEEAQRAHGPCLELGCGTGRILRPLAELGHPVLGVDESPAMLAHLGDLPCVCSPIETLRLDRTFDA
ncbi:MAG: class I SAM-dependent methyltransferase, partial [Chloroflexota bacterium]|nr:class I SAM-dependent methyltransferase [Chloroflexota bacterium]